MQAKQTLMAIAFLGVLLSHASAKQASQAAQSALDKQASQAAQSAQTKFITVNATVAVDQTGKARSFEYLSGLDVAPSVDAYVRPILMNTEFAPAKISGKAVDASVPVEVVLRADPLAKGFSIHLVEVRKGFPRLSQGINRLRYPDQMMLGGISAHILVQMVVGSDGKPDLDSMQLVGEPTVIDEKRRVNKFFDAVKRTAPHMLFDNLEIVGGRPVASTVRVPFVFCINSCDAIHAEVERIRAKERALPQLKDGDQVTQIKASPQPPAGADASG